MSRDRVPPNQRVYAIIRTRRSVVRRRLRTGVVQLPLADILETVRGESAMWDALERHRKALGYGDGWFVKRDRAGRWRMYDAHYHPIPQHVTPDHRCKDWAAAHFLMEHLLDADHGKRREAARKKSGPPVRLRDTLRKPPMEFEVSAEEAERLLTLKGIVRA